MIYSQILMICLIGTSIISTFKKNDATFLGTKSEVNFHKSETTALSDEQDDYIDFINSDANGMLACRGAYNGTDYKMQFYSYYWDNNQNPVTYHSLDYKDVSVSKEGNTFNKPFYNVTSSLFGTTHVALLMKNATDTIYYDSLYAPKALKWSYSPADTPITSSTVINWTADNNNPKGVIITVDFSPTHNMHDSLMRNSDPIKNQAHVVDDGSYTMGSGLFSGISSGAYVIVAVSRGNYKKLPSKQNDDEYKWTILMREQAKLEYN
ncbi:MAG: hypothetical protein CL840_17260 [Crocinitomicaceae bacterium]|nr:hypothetical protein [Crocinitomicaceae bacterium]|tara:strand:+ start:4351 stop:5145 length:795 start_codon:yes stop_codon:yes gene_type:complete